MDYSIIQGADGNPEFSWDKPTDITTNIYTSLIVRKGALFNMPNFGLDLSDISKVTDNSINKIHSRLHVALQWLIDVGKAKSIDITVERDTTVNNRINYKVEAVQADGIPVTVDSFQTVGAS